MSDRQPDQGPPAAGWHRALAYALCGVDLAGLPERPAPDGAALAEELAAAGWDRTALGRHAEERRQAGEPWPHPVPAGLAEGLPAAQFAAALRELVSGWGLASTPHRVRSARADRPAAGDERLRRDLPPHFGKL